MNLNYSATAAATLSANLSDTPLSKTHYQILIVGGGAAGITVAAQLLKQNRKLDIGIVEPSDQHHYQPGWTLVGGGIAPVEEFTRPQKSVIPPGSTWIQERVDALQPDDNAIRLSDGTILTYDTLIVCPGIQIDWSAIQGLPEALGKDGVTSNYSRDFAPYTWQAINEFKGGTAIFTYPATPIKCGGAPQKVMYMADDVFQRKSGVGVNTRVMFCTAGQVLFGVPDYARSLQKVVDRRGIDVQYQHNLTEIDAAKKEAVFAVTTPEGVTTQRIAYDLIHVAPPMSAPDFIKQSPLSNGTPGGWVEVDAATLQHVRYPNVFSLGDASSAPTSKTAAAARKQAPVVVGNVLAFLESKPLATQYDGYTCCPLITGYNSTIMAEFGYNNRLMPSFPLDPTQERYSMFVAKAYALPWLYWNRMLPGEGFEADMFKPLNRLVHG